MREHQGMTQRDQLGGPLGGRDAGDAGDFERIALGVGRQFPQNLRRNPHERMSASGAARVALGADVHHARASGRIVVRKFFHFGSTWISSPAGYSARPESATRYALARVSAGTSLEPLQRTGVTSVPSGLSSAGRKRVRPVLCRNSRVSLAYGMGSETSSCPDSSSRAARAKISKVTMVEAGFPGRPKKNFSPARPKTSGWPG